MIAFAALALAFIMTIGALAVDGGGVIAARDEARQAADAAALAAASAFVDGDASFAQPRAVEYATKNAIRGVKVKASEVHVVVVEDSTKVYVTIERAGVPLWFARALGFNTVTIKAKATAGTRAATSAKCVKPFAPPDLWHDQDNDTNGNRIPDPSETWGFSASAGDFYRTFGASTPNNKPFTGYGSNYRGRFRDVGTRVVLRPVGGNSSFDNNRFYTWTLPVDPNMPLDCRYYASGSDQSAAAFRGNLCNCNNTKIVAGTTYPVENANRAGPLQQGVDELIRLDPNAVWNDVTRRVDGSAYTPWMTSPRVVKIPLWSPVRPSEPGGGVKFVAFQVFFIESQPTNNSPITGRIVNIVREVRLLD